MKRVCFCMSEKIHRLNGGACFCMSEKICRINRRGLLLYVRKDIPTQWREFAFVCQRIYTDSMKGGLLFYLREDIPTQ